MKLIMFMYFGAMGPMFQFDMGCRFVFGLIISWKFEINQ